MEHVRCFIAIKLPDEIKAELNHLQAELKSGGTCSAKWVNPDGIHLTLKFLGNVATDRLGEVTSAMKGAARGVMPFHLHLEGLGAFPSLERAQVVWVGIGGEVEQLGQLHQRIDSALSQLGFAPEGRRFTPHLTLARMRREAPPPDGRRLGQLLADARPEASHRFEVHDIHLIKSQLTREGAVYSQISTASLGEDTELSTDPD